MLNENVCNSWFLIVIFPCKISSNQKTITESQIYDVGRHSSKQQIDPGILNGCDQTGLVMSKVILNEKSERSRE